MATTSQITGRVLLPDDTAPVDGILKFVLSGMDTDGGDVIAPYERSFALEVNGDIPASCEIYQNSEGLRGTIYTVYVLHSQIDTFGGSSKFFERKLGTIQINEPGTHLLSDLLDAGAPVVPGSWVMAITEEQYNAAIEAAAQAQAFGAAYNQTDADMLAITIPATVKLIHRFPLTASSVDQVAPVQKLTTWHRWTGSTEGKKWFADASGAVFVLVGLTEELLLSVVGSAINGLATDPVYGVATFSSLAAFNAADIPASTKQARVLAPVSEPEAQHVLLFARQTGAAFSGLKAGWVPDGDVYPEHFGAQTYGTLTDVAAGVDAYPAIASAYAFVCSGKTSASNGERGRLCLRAKYYRLSQTFIMDADRIDIHCPIGAVFYIAHSTGAGVWFQRSSIDGGNLEIRGDYTRSSTMNKENMGLRIEPAVDDAALLVSQFDISRMKIRFHGGSGVVANSCSGVTHDGVEINNCLRHGLVVCNYAETDRVNFRSTGMVNIGGNTRISACAGHRILVGNSSGSGAQSGYRVIVDNIDGDGCGTNPAIMLEPSVDFYRGGSIDIRGGAFPVSASLAGVSLCGSNVRLSGSVRFTNGGSAPANLILLRDYGASLPTENISIGNFQVLTGASPTVAAVDIGAGVNPAHVTIKNDLILAQPLLSAASVPVLDMGGATGSYEFGASAFRRTKLSGLKPIYFPDTVQPSTGTGTVTADRLYFFPITVPPDYPIDTLSIEVTAGAAGNARLGLYAHNPLTGKPSLLIEQSGDISTISAGTLMFTLTTPLIGRRLVWGAVTFSAVPTIRNGGATSVGMLGAASLTTVNSALRVTRTYGAMPSDAAAEVFSLVTDRVVFGLSQA